MLGNGAIVMLDGPTAFVLTALHVQQQICAAAAQGSAITAFAGPAASLISAPVNVAATCQSAQSSAADIALMRIDVSQFIAQLRIPLIIRPLPIGPALGNQSVSVRTFGYFPDHRELDYQPKSVVRRGSEQRWEFYIRTTVIPGASGSPILMESRGERASEHELAVVGVVTEGQKPTPCPQHPDAEVIIDPVRLARCELALNLANGLLTAGVELQSFRSVLSSLPLDPRSRDRIDLARRHYEALSRRDFDENEVVESIRALYTELEPLNYLGWDRYYSDDLESWQTARVLAFWEEKFPDCPVPDTVAYVFRQMAARFYTPDQISQLIDASSQCRIAPTRTAEIVEALVARQHMGQSVENGYAMDAFIRDVAQRYDLTDQQIVSAERGNLTELIERAEHERFTQ